MTGKTANLHPELVDVLTRLEEFLGFEVTVNSGHRSQEHNASPAVGGVPDSEHTYLPAEGADILCKQSITRFKMIRWLLGQGIRRIGIGKDFVHVGIADDKPQYVMWLYGEK